MLCPKCNYTVDDSANFCQNCGYKFPKTNEAPPELKYVPLKAENLKIGADASEETPDRYKKSVSVSNARVEKMNTGKYILFGGLGACVGLLLLVIIISFFI